MDANELVKHAPEIAKAATAVAAAVPFTAIVKRMLGPAADELAEMWKDQIRLYRYERQLKCVEKAERMAQEAGFTPQAVPPKILFPLLEGASFEEDENLHDMWAALLANASMERAIVIRPRYIALLRDMVPDEAELLNLLSSVQETIRNLTTNVTTGQFEQIQTRLVEVRNNVKGTFHEISSESEADKESRFATCLAVLQTAGLTYDYNLTGFGDCYLTPSGHEFLRACQPPKPKPTS
jgi:hypothetical protein